MIGASATKGLRGYGGEWPQAGPHRQRSGRSTLSYRKDVNDEKTPSKQERSDDRLRVRCKDRPRDNKPRGKGGGGKVFIPWC